MNKSVFAVIAAVIVLGVGGALWIANNDDTSDTLDTNQVQNPSNASSPTQTDTPGAANENNGTSNNNEVADDAGAVNVTMQLSNYAFSVDEITANPGDTVTVAIESTEGTHNFTLDEFDVQSSTVNSGQSDSFSFTVPEDASGEYEFYCSISNHRELGMVGTLTVLAP